MRMRSYILNTVILNLIIKTKTQQQIVSQVFCLEGLMCTIKLMPPVMCIIERIKRTFWVGICGEEARHKRVVTLAQ